MFCCYNCFQVVMHYVDCLILQLRLVDTFEDDNSLKRFIDSLPSSSGMAALDKGLLKAQKLFNSQQARKEASKVLVVITDGETGTNKEAIKMAAKDLIKNDVKIIPVAIGSDPEKELDNEIPDESVIKTNVTDDPRDIADLIMDKVTAGQ